MLSLLFPVVSALPLFEFVELSQPHSQQPSPSDELRELQWGDLNFLHTTDTHGWLAGHLLEPEFSGDWGDFVSFSERMHDIAKQKKADLILVDTGDRHDGNGLSDASKKDGSLSLPIFGEIDYDVVTIGNHELYRGTASLQEFHDIRKHFGDRYVVSNVEVAVGDAWVPLGNKYRVFRTKNQNKKILAFGFLFDFTGNDREVSRVTPVAQEIQKRWFRTVLRDIVPTIDHIVLAGHIPAAHAPEFETILAAIRAVRPTVPVSMFGGHSHIRDFHVYDDYAACLQSGRYVETLGWSSYKEVDGHPEFSRSYIDFNARTMAYHAEVDDVATRHGKSVSKDIAKARASLDLDRFFAEVPQNYFMDRAPYPSKDSIYSLLTDHVLPLLTSPKEVAGQTRYVFMNTGGIRFDLFKGPFTRDTGYIIVPFNNDWFYVKDVPRDVADHILPFLNDQDRVLSESLQAKSRLAGASALKKSGSEGYSTHDDMGADGDDTVHTPWEFYPLPNCVQATIEGTSAEGESAEGESEKVTLIFHDFLASFVQRALEDVGRGDLFDPILHGGEKVIELIPRYFRSLYLSDQN